MMDIVERLNEAMECNGNDPLVADALREIQRLRAEVAALRQFHHDQQQLVERVETLVNINNLLREQLRVCTDERNELFAAMKGT